MSDFERALGAMDRVGRHLQLRDMLTAIHDLDRRKCGYCEHWMKKSSCPQEGGMDGRWRGGPSSGSPACFKFSVTVETAALKATRVDEAKAFAAEHGLPFPEVRT